MSVAETRLTRDAIIYMGAAALNALAPFMLVPVLTRWLGPEGFGVVGGFMAMVNVGAVVVGLSTHGQISVAYFRDGAATLAGTVGAALAVMALTGLPLLVLLLSVGETIEVATGVTSGWLWTAWTSACGQFVVMVTLAVRQVRGEVWQYGTTQISYTLLWVTLTLLLVGFVGMGWQGRALGQAAAALVAIGACLVLLTRSGNLTWKIREWPLSSVLRFGLPLLPHSLAAIALSTVDRFALSSNAGVNATGQYFAAFQIAFVLTAAATALNQAWLPWMYARLARREAAAKGEIVRVTYLMYGFLLGAALLMVLGKTPLVHAVAGAQFVSSANLLSYLAPAAAFGGMYFFVTGYLFYAGRTGLLSTITVTVAVVQLALIIWLVQEGGATGVAQAVLFSSVLYWAITAIAANRVIPMPWLQWRALAHNASTPRT
jgi:O-antigen/teichoic acid export membrane protein